MHAHDTYAQDQLMTDSIDRAALVLAAGSYSSGTRAGEPDPETDAVAVAQGQRLALVSRVIGSRRSGASWTCVEASSPERRL